MPMLGSLLGVGCREPGSSPRCGAGPQSVLLLPESSSNGHQVSLLLEWKHHNQTFISEERFIATVVRFFFRCHRSQENLGNYEFF